MMNEKSHLSKPVSTHYSKRNKRKEIATANLTFDTKKLMKGILVLVLRLACVRHNNMQLQFNAKLFG